jgi:geranylgeranyl pyrophosphate synthase
MGMHFGMMFQLLDDFKDIDEDKTSTNYVHLNGIKNAQIKYAAARLKFITLLHKHSLNTQAFADLIGAMDKRFAIDETHQVSRCEN